MANSSDDGTKHVASDYDEADQDREGERCTCGARHMASHNALCRYCSMREEEKS